MILFAIEEKKWMRVVDLTCYIINNLIRWIYRLIKFFSSLNQSGKMNRIGVCFYWKDEEEEEEKLSKMNSKQQQQNENHWTKEKKKEREKKIFKYKVLPWMWERAPGRWFFFFPCFFSMLLKNQVMMVANNYQHLNHIVVDFWLVLLDHVVVDF